MDSLHVDISRIQSLDLRSQATRLRRSPHRRPSQMELSVINPAIDAAALVSNKGKLFQEVRDLGSLRRRVPVRVTGVGPSSLVRMAPVSDLTVGIGATGSIYAVAGGSIGAGLYGSTTPEFGVYGSVGVGIGLAAAMSAGAQITFIFGPPSTFAGISTGISLGASIPGTSVGVAVTLLCAGLPTSLPLTFIGFSIEVTGGTPAMLPVSVVLEAGRTGIRRIL